MYDYLLPLGSIVNINGIERKLMIIGYLQKSVKNTKEVFDYISVAYPEGYFIIDTSFLFNHNDISQIVFEGYTDKEAEVFNSLLSYAGSQEESIKGKEESLDENKD